MMSADMMFALIALSCRIADQLKEKYARPEVSRLWVSFDSFNLIICVTPCRWMLLLNLYFQSFSNFADSISLYDQAFHMYSFFCHIFCLRIHGTIQYNMWSFCFFSLSLVHHGNATTNKCRACIFCSLQLDDFGVHWFLGPFRFSQWLPLKWMPLNSMMSLLLPAF